MKVTKFDSALVYALLAINLWISYSVLQDLSHRSGMAMYQSYAWPLTIDALIVISTRNVVQFGKHPAKRYAWFLLVLSAAASIAFNIRHILLVPQEVDVVTSIAVATVAPLGALLVTHLAVLRSRVRHELEHSAAPDAAPAAPAALGWMRTVAAGVRDAKTILTGTPAPEVDAPTAAPAAPPTQPNAAPAAPTASRTAAPSAAQLRDGDAPLAAPLPHPAGEADTQPLRRTPAAVTHPAAPPAAPAAAHAAPRPAAAPHPVPHPVSDAPDAPRPITSAASSDEEVRRRVVELLAANQSGRRIERTTAAEGRKVSERTVRRIKEEALDTGELVETPDGKYALNPDHELAAAVS